MKYLEDYIQPKDDEIKNWTLDQAKALDERNKDIYWRNKTLVQNARAILMDVDPANRTLRDIEAPVPPYQYVRVLQQMQERERSGEKPAAKKK